MDAIIYTTNTGSTERYAKLLAQEIGLLTYSLTEAKKVRGNIYETLFWKHNYNRYNGNDSCPVGLSNINEIKLSLILKTYLSRIRKEKSR